MSQLPDDPQLPASARQLRGAGAIFLAAGTSFLAFTAWLLSAAHTSSRLGQWPVILLTALMLLIGIGCFDAAFAVFCQQTHRRKHLLSAPALYVIGGLLTAFPLLVLVFLGIAQPGENLWTVWKITPLSAFGIWAFRLAVLRRKAQSS